MTIEGASIREACSRRETLYCLGMYKEIARRAEVFDWNLQSGAVRATVHEERGPLGKCKGIHVVRFFSRKTPLDGNHW